MRIIILAIWGVALLVFTCAADSNFWVTGTLPTFRFAASPDFHNLLKLDWMNSPAYIIRKIGHFMGFLMFGVLLFTVLKKYIASILYSVAFAVSTEIFQLYFGRDGRLYDVVIDSAGIITGMLLMYACRGYKRLRVN